MLFARPGRANGRPLVCPGVSSLVLISPVLTGTYPRLALATARPALAVLRRSSFENLPFVDKLPPARRSHS